MCPHPVATDRFESDKALHGTVPIQPCMCELKLAAYGRSVDRQSLHWRFSFTRLPGGLPRRLFPECLSVRNKTDVKTEDG